MAMFMYKVHSQHGKAKFELTPERFQQNGWEGYTERQVSAEGRF